VVVPLKRFAKTIEAAGKGGIPTLMYNVIGFRDIGVVRSPGLVDDRPSANLTK